MSATPRQIESVEKLVATLVLKGWRGNAEDVAAVLADAQDAARLKAVVIAARDHVAELAEAWERGALSERDGKGGERSNRNADLLRRLRAALVLGAK